MKKQTIIGAFIICVCFFLVGCGASAKKVNEQIDLLCTQYQLPTTEREKKKEKKIMASELFQPAVINRISETEDVSTLVQLAYNLELSSYNDPEVKAAFQARLNELVPSLESDRFTDDVVDYIRALNPYRKEGVESTFYYYEGASELDNTICEFVRNKDDIWELLQFAAQLEDKSLNYQNELIQEEYERVFSDENLIHFNSVDEFIQYVDQARDYSNLSYYVKLVQLFPYKSIKAYIEKNGDALSTKSSAGYYVENAKKFKDSSRVVDPLGIWNGKSGVGTYTVKNKYDLYGDFMVHHYSERWYDTPATDSINKSETTMYCMGKSIITNENAVKKLQDTIKTSPAFYFGDNIDEAKTFLITTIGRNEILFILKGYIMFGVVYS